MITLLLRGAQQVTQGPSRLPVLSRLAVCASQQLTWPQVRHYGIKLTDGEKALTNKLKQQFPGAKHVEVSDVSGGCGAMYQISIEAEEFKGKKKVIQHRMVNEVLAEELKTMHGLQLNTKAPDS